MATNTRWITRRNNALNNVEVEFFIARAEDQNTLILETVEVLNGRRESLRATLFKLHDLGVTWAELSKILGYRSTSGARCLAYGETGRHKRAEK